MVQKKNSKTIKKTIIYTLIIAIFTVTLTVFFNEYKPFLLSLKAYHYFILSFVIIILIMLFIRMNLKRKEKLLFDESKFTNESKIESHTISNEEIQQIIFSGIDVLTDEEEKNIRTKEILLALRLGVLFRKKVSIFFMNSDKYFTITDLIIKSKDDKIELKSGGQIPIEAIYKIGIPK
jgi:Ca2+/H+ antiporter